MAKKKLAKWKAEEMLHNPPHGKKLTDKQRKYFAAVAYGQDGAKVERGVLSYFNPKNWGVEDYTEEGDFNKAFKKARENNQKEFIFGDERYNTNKKQVEKVSGKTFNEVFGKARKKGLEEFIWYNEDAVIAPNKGKYTTKLVDKEVSDNYWNSKKFLNKYLDEAILSASPEDSSLYGPGIPLRIANQRQSSIEDLNKLTYLSITKEDVMGTTLGSYTGQYNKLYINALDKTVPVHELAHKAQLRTNTSDTEKLVRKYGDYYGDPHERAARHISTKYYLNSLGQNYENITAKEYELLKKDKNLPGDIKDLFTIYPTKEEFIKQLNTPVGYDPKQSFKNGGNIIKDNRGQWAHPGKVTQIDSNQITMKGVNYPVLGVSDTGDTQMMYPNQEYNFNGKTVTEFPMAKSGIHIDPKNKGKFNALKKRTGKSTEELTHSKNPLTRKRAIFAQNAAKWDKGQSGAMLSTNESLELLKPFAQDDLEELKLRNALLVERQQKRDSVRSILNKQFPNKYTNVSRGMTDYYKTEPPEYLQLDVNMLDDNRRKALLQTYGKKFENGGKAKKAQWGYSEPSMEEYYPMGTGMSNPNGSGQIPIDAQPKPSLYNRIGGTAGVVQGINAVGYGMNAPGEASTAQKTVGQFGPWGQAISQVSQMGTNYFNNASNTLGNNYASAIFDPAATFENKDLSSTDRIIGGFSPTYAAFAKRKARKQQKEKEDRLNAVVKQASELGPDEDRRRYVRPEDQLIDPNQMFPTYGVGTNYLKYGGEVPHMEKGGELQTYWGGEAEPLSENRYLPGGGETVMFRGKSHLEGGIGVKFGGSKVEVEGGEPAVKLNDGNKEALTVFGDMKIPSYGVSELNDPKAKGKKFKNYINELSKIENKQNKVVEKGVNLVNDTPPRDSFDKLTISSGKAMIEGGNMKLKQIADKKQIAANVQNAILETAEEFGLKSDELAKGKFKKAKMGKKIGYYQNGGQYTIPRYQMDEYQAYGYLPDPEDPNRMYRDLRTSGSTQTIPVTPPGKGSEEFNAAFAQARKQKLPEFTFKGKQYTTDLFQGRTRTITNPGTTNRDYIYLQDDMPLAVYPGESTIPGTGNPATEAVQQKERMDWLPIVNSIIPFIRPSNQMKLDQNQLLGEMNALANNQLEPVQAQLYEPLLENVSDISLQDQLNANQADFNAIQRLTAQNPAAQATLAAQKYQANSSVLGEQFRQNQSQKMNVFNRNRGVLNDATLKNLAILDQQYVRQSQAKSNTKAVAQQAINSISEKIARNKLENRTLGVYENLYNYRFDNSGRAWNMNPLAQFVIDQGAIKVDSNSKIAMDETKIKRDRFGNIINSTETSRTTDVPKRKNGGIVKAIKSL